MLLIIWLEIPITALLFTSSIFPALQAGIKHLPS